MSCNFMPCYLIRLFHVLQFRTLLFGPFISCPAISCPAMWSLYFMSCNFTSYSIAGPSISCSFSQPKMKPVHLRIYMTYAKRHHHQHFYKFTWLPKTPIDVAVDTSPGPNHTAASLAGIPSIKICATAHTVWAVIWTANLDNLDESMAAHLIHAPIALSRAPTMAVTRRP